MSPAPAKQRKVRLLQVVCEGASLRVQQLDDDPGEAVAAHLRHTQQPLAMLLDEARQDDQ